MSKSSVEIQTIVDLAIKKWQQPNRSARDLAACESLFLDALESYTELLGTRHQTVGYINWYLALVYSNMPSEFDKAEAHFEAAAERYSDPAMLADIANHYADMLVKKGTKLMKDAGQVDQVFEMPEHSPSSQDAAGLLRTVARTATSERDRVTKRLRDIADMNEDAASAFNRADALRVKAFTLLKNAIKSPQKGPEAKKDTATETVKSKRPPITTRTPAEIMAILDKAAIGQRAAKRGLANAAAQHIKRMLMTAEERKLTDKSNVLLVGPTGCGKTLLSAALADALDLPFHATEATDLTAAGYVGGDVKSVIFGLLRACDYDVERAQYGVVFIDEIDKIAAHGMGGQKDVGGRAVQEELLKILEGTVIRCKKPDGNVVELNTTNILFIVGGAFVGLGDVVMKRMKDDAPRIGFGANPQGEVKDTSKFQKFAQAKDFFAFGMIPEFIGRLPKRLVINALTVDQLERILVEPNKALTGQQRLLLKSTTDLRFTRGALRAIAEEAHETGTHGRALREIMDQVLEPIVFAQPTVAIITAEMVKNRNAEIDAVNVDDDQLQVPANHAYIIDDDRVEEVLAAATAEAKLRVNAAPASTSRELVVINK